MRVKYTVDIELECESKGAGGHELETILKQHPQLDFEVTDSEITEEDEVESEE